MQKQSLKERLYKFLLRKHGFVSSGDLQRLVMEHTNYLPRTTVRRLQEMHEEGLLERMIVRGHTHYKAKAPPQTHQNATGRTQSPSRDELLEIAKQNVLAFDRA